MASVFLRDDAYYQRRLNPIEDYFRQSALYLHISSGASFEECYTFVKTSIKSGQFPLAEDPFVVFFQREDNGDRVKRQQRLSEYIRTIVNSNYILAPSFTCYLPPSVLRSHLSEFVERNKKVRAVAKKAAFVYKAQNKMDLYTIKNNEQTNMKLSNNSVSGAFCTNGCILYNPTAHSTLTSTTRTVSSFGNTTNERIVAGNRHYWSPEIALYNILSIIDNVDFVEFKEAMTLFNLSYPTSDDVIDCITYSSDFYWKNNKEVHKLKTFVDKLLPIQRAAFVYIGDLFHIRKHNKLFIRSLISALSKKCNNIVENPKSVIKTFTSSELNLAYHICFEEMKGKEKDDHDKLEAAGVLNLLVSTALNIRSVFESYRLFIQAFFLTRAVPPSIAYLKNMVRRSVVVSDTDSTCASYQEWIEWYCGRVIFDDTSMAVAASVMTIATETIAHVLSLFSANMNVERSKLHAISMKNEFTWLMMTPTDVAKHYFALTAVQEGNVFAIPEMEIKGVHLKNSSTGGDIIKKARDLMQEISQKIINNETLSLEHYLKETARLEREVTESLLRGDLTYYRKAQIKDKASYKLDESKSPYQMYRFWKDIFEERYGQITPPPYSVIKMPTSIVNKTALAVWIASIEDKSLAERLLRWCQTYNKKTLPTLYIPIDFILTHGLIEEFQRVLDSKRLVLDVLKAHYIILQSIGFYKRINSTLTELGY